MPNLNDILSAGGYGGNDFNDNWDRTEAAGEFAPLPAGEYEATIERGDLVNVGAKETPGYKLSFSVIKGPGPDSQYAGRKFWHDVWLTPAAIPQAKRDLGKIGVTDPKQLSKPAPKGLICNVKLALRRDDNGNEHNRVVQFDVVRVEKPQADPYAPQEPEAPPAAKWQPTEEHYDG